MLDHAILRRTITIPVVFLVFAALTSLAPLILIVAVIFDGIRLFRMGARWMTTRSIAFAWFYLLGELWAVVCLAVVAITGRKRSIQLTYRLQRLWARWNFRALQSLFDLEFEVAGAELASQPPFILLSRHASLIDTLIPAEFIARPFDVRIRYVLKKELLLDPALDIAGSRLPNCFIDRGSGESERDRDSIRRLVSTMGSSEAVLIYPEGTRYSNEKKQRIRSRFQARSGPIAEIAMGLENLLPPRPGGTLTILEASDVDVVLLAHHGLEGFARIGDIWSGELVGRTIKVRMTRVSREDIPTERNDRVDWLFETWAELDLWVDHESAQTRQP